ncbi:hypothetical protein JOD02_001172 [Caldicoprobacter guelmensis]|uniref:hypothetical protein n=1 Tax=Caldicoprobacter guelmensis TaxID=1170224 RepID=UPI0019568594|nr:hypothetical protein [Caldicoprobacter guelmensis]MBM7582315.1 hypothetical protein [Caldicoprobacter guelmensis]
MYIGRKSVFLGAVALIILGMIMGYTYTLLTEMFQDEERIEKEKAQDNNEGVLFNSFEPLAVAEPLQTTSETTTFIFERVYNLCGHNLVSYRSATPQEVGLSRKQVKDMYSSWDIKEFSASIVWLCERVDGYCPNHYVIKDNDGRIAICRPLEDGRGFYLIRQTSIDTAFLDADLQERVKEGWVVDSLEQVEQLVESWDS